MSLEKYGRNQVAQIITYGSMAAKSSIRDVGRVLDIPLPDVEKVTKLVPDTSLDKVFNWDDAMIKKMLNAEQSRSSKSNAFYHCRKRHLLPKL